MVAGTLHVVADTPIAELHVAGWLQPQPFRCCLRHRLLGRECGRARRGGRARSRDGEGRLLGGDEAAEVHLLAGAPHPCLVLVSVRLVDDSLVAGRKVARLELEPFCRCLSHHLFGRERHSLGSCNLRPRLGRPRNSQGRLLRSDIGAEVHQLTGA
eukprot:scaffold46996_cov60-Phaeocystis_antarctica.AAC.3